MSPSSKRKSRLVIALSAAVLLAAALIYTSFASATEAREPSELAQVEDGVSYTMTGRVVPGSVRRDGDGIAFKVADRDGGSALATTYEGAVPDPFRGGREIILTGAMQDQTFVGEPDTLITKCPSKFEEEEWEKKGSTPSQEWGR